MEKIERVDDPPPHRYPATPSSRGWAKLRHRKRDYYFGPHASAQSYALFAVWLHELQEKKEAPNTKDLKDRVAQFLDGEETKLTPYQRLTPFLTPCLAVLLLISTTIAIVATSKIPSSDPPPVVDDLALTEDEKDFVRGMRGVRERVMLKPSFPAIDASRLTERLDEPLHRLGKEP